VCNELQLCEITIQSLWPYEISLNRTTARVTNDQGFGSNMMASTFVLFVSAMLFPWLSLNLRYTIITEYSGSTPGTEKKNDKLGPEITVMAPLPRLK